MLQGLHHHCSDHYVKQPITRSERPESVTKTFSLDKNISWSFSEVSASPHSEMTINIIRFCSIILCLCSHIVLRSLKPTSSAFSLCSTVKSKLHQYKKMLHSLPARLGHVHNGFSSFSKFTMKFHLYRFIK